jgi:hypothetical protein
MVLLNKVKLKARFAKENIMAKLTEAEKRKNWEKTVGSSENDMEPLSKERKEALSSKVDVKEMPTSKERFLRAYGNELSDAKKQFKETGNIPESRTENLGPGVFGIGASSDSIAKGHILGRQEMREAIKKERARAGMKKGGMVKSSASKRADGIATKGKTRGRLI